MFGIQIFWREFIFGRAAKFSNFKHSAFRSVNYYWQKDGHCTTTLTLETEIKVMECDLQSEGRVFESQHHTLDGHFSYWFVVKIVLIFVWKRPKINEKDARDGPFKKYQFNTVFITLVTLHHEVYLVNAFNVGSRMITACGFVYKPPTYSFDLSILSTYQVLYLCTFDFTWPGT